MVVHLRDAEVLQINISMNLHRRAFYRIRMVQGYTTQEQNP
jgi:hypothetical protein